MKINRAAAIALAALAGVLVYAAVVPPAGPRSIRVFDADRVADLELRMWQAYYAKQRVHLFALLVTLLHEQYRYPWGTASVEGFHLARAAATFAETKPNTNPRGYEVVLPDLEAAYRTAKNWLRAGFDPRSVARAELAWWVARRLPGSNHPAHVGELMADEYALLYETPRSRVLRAAMLRAEAAAIRDDTAASPDWAVIGDLLRQSYRELLAGVNMAVAQRGTAAGRNDPAIPWTSGTPREPRPDL